MSSSNKRKKATSSYVVPFNETHRLVRFMTLLPLTTSGPSSERVPIDYRVYIQASVYLAFLSLPRAPTHDNNNINKNNLQLPTRLLPQLDERIQRSCSNVVFDLKMYDTQFSNLKAASKLLPLLQGQGEIMPSAMVGAARLGL